MIGLFAELQFRLPNLVVALITRDRVRAALLAGIRASQVGMGCGGSGVIGWFEAHVRPEPILLPGPWPSSCPAISDVL